jgi:hypothetical protein
MASPKQNDSEPFKVVMLGSPAVGKTTFFQAIVVRSSWLFLTAQNADYSALPSVHTTLGSDFVRAQSFVCDLLLKHVIPREDSLTNGKKVALVDFF